MTLEETRPEEWTRARLHDEIYLSLMKVEQNKEGIPRRKYEAEAREKIGWVAVPPHGNAIFVIHLKDLDANVKEELLKENPISRNDILKNVVDSIYEQIDSRYYLLNARRFVKVRLEE